MFCLPQRVAAVLLVLLMLQVTSAAQVCVARCAGGDLEHGTRVAEMLSAHAAPPPVSPIDAPFMPDAHASLCAIGSAVAFVPATVNAVEVSLLELSSVIWEAGHYVSPALPPPDPPPKARRDEALEWWGDPPRCPPR